jgi:1-aminocyclopropane-1-carboxylate deaminase/D-cysteine desulfhydrase-like pyridoxal-dependent ACC family enzyme
VSTAYAELVLPELERIPRLPLAVAPTPLQETPRLAAALGLDRLIVKRDDNTGLALGGNKARKLEYLAAAALEEDADLLLTTGAPQSNHCRITAAAARIAGLDAHFVFDGAAIGEVQGNLVLDRLLGATWSFAGDRPGPERMAELAEELRRQGRRPYVIPRGGSNGLGALGYVRCALELAEQLEERGARTREIMAESCELLDLALPDAAPTIWDGYIGRGYGMPTALSTRALEMAARTEGLILDPVYTAKAFAGLIGEVETGQVKRDELVVFVHTGGTPALFAETSLYWHPD